MEQKDVKLTIFVRGEEAYAFLRDVRETARAMKESWNADNPKAVTIFTIGGNGPEHGW
ncbi:hypothetical protein LCGC14_2859190 [marine sediment metagenome]|uniref:Uncharacterized protein n=1 Tax=marine sediment metagenome TaxID=412755 RepID=A0A0F8Y655_9ZZZZ